MFAFCVISQHENDADSRIFPVENKDPFLGCDDILPELELKLIVKIGIGIENNGIGIELKKWNWPQPCRWELHLQAVLKKDRFNR